MCASVLNAEAIARIRGLPRPIIIHFVTVLGSRAGAASLAAAARDDRGVRVNVVGGALDEVATTLAAREENRYEVWLFGALLSCRLCQGMHNITAARNRSRWCCTRETCTTHRCLQLGTAGVVRRDGTVTTARGLTKVRLATKMGPQRRRW